MQYKKKNSTQSISRYGKLCNFSYQRDFQQSSPRNRYCEIPIIKIVINLQQKDYYYNYV